MQSGECTNLLRGHMGPIWCIWYDPSSSHPLNPRVREVGVSGKRPGAINFHKMLQKARMHHGHFPWQDDRREMRPIFGSQQQTKPPRP